MSISIVTFTNGNHVICELKEIFNMDGETNKGICLLMREPYVLNFYETHPKENQTEYQISFNKWNPYSSDSEYKIPYTSVVSISTPEENLKEAYQNKIGEKLENYDDTKSTEN